MSRSATQLLADDIEHGDGKRVHLVARFNGTDYHLGTAQPVNALAVELVDLLRHTADEIEAVRLMREASPAADDPAAVDTQLDHIAGYAYDQNGGTS